MSPINFKKFSNKKELRSLLQELVNALEIAIDIEEVSGTRLFSIGEQTANNRYPIKVSEEVIGWVVGEQKAAIAATFLSFLAKQESEKKDLAKELLERYQEIDLFEDISTQLTTSLDTQQIAQLVLQEIHQLIESSVGIIVLLKPNSIDANAAAFETIAEFGQFQEHYPSELRQGIIGSVVQYGRAELVNDIGSDQTYLDQSTEAIGQGNVRALICAPLRAKEHILGAIAIGTGRSDIYTAEHLKLVNIFASQTAVAIEKALLYEQSCQAAIQAKAQANRLQQVIKDLQLAQTQLIQSEKMSSLGQLIAGVAHEINNPVNFICGNIKYVSRYATELIQLLQLYQNSFPVAPPELESQIENIDLEFLMQDLPKLLTSMRLGTDRIVEIVKSLKNFSRLDEAEMKVVNIHEGIDVTLMILRHRLKASSDRPEIQVIKEYGDLPLVECYPGQLNQVLMNILVNAIDALEENIDKKEYPVSSDLKCLSYPTPTIQIETESINNEWIIIRITDNGPGMPEEIIQRIYDPFFTTKEIGKGTGLGMAISYQLIVDKHRGMLKCHSYPGKGTEFWIQIPVKCPTGKGAEGQCSQVVSSHEAITPRADSSELTISPITDSILSKVLAPQPYDLLLQHIHLIQRLAQQYPEVENMSSAQIYQMFQHNPISLKLYATLLSQFYCPNPIHSLH
ncbi:MAG: GAF domain-containing sensor histidine kinase [Oscillatoriophycideae cyanobacterium NC_groundwater_1537_Pr4_S-0.65um_50_18]|nr:GAF domain-containing sensor histidine kinase [Oscillatoriophycideae cyanobacterium NC_groundwater_1537_Pr4_S-0.65um_50_18]